MPQHDGTSRSSSPSDPHGSGEAPQPGELRLSPLVERLSRAPSAYGYLLALVFILVGGALLGTSLMMLTQRLREYPQNLTRIRAPGHDRASLPHPGRYRLFYEYRSQFDDQPIASPEQPPAMSVTIVGPGQQPTELEAQPDAGGYVSDTYAAVPIGDFQAPTAGGYRFHVELTGQPETGPAPRSFVLAIGQPVLEPLGWLQAIVYFSVVVAPVLVLVGVILAGWLFWVRISAVRDWARSKRD